MSIYLTEFSNVILHQSVEWNIIYISIKIGLNIIYITTIGTILQNGKLTKN